MLYSFAQKKVLFVMSAASELKLTNGKPYSQSGVFLSEVYLAYKDISAEGYEIDFATPLGIKSFIDVESAKTKYWRRQDSLFTMAQSFVATDVTFNHPYTLDQVVKNLHQYSGLVIPGGQGLMVDLLNNKTVSEIIIEFHKQKKPIGLICHAPALLLFFPKDENPFVGYKVNSVTGLEEFFIERFVMKGKPFTRKIAKKLKAHGLKYRKRFAGRSFAIRDRELITSQNPFSNNAFSKLYIQALKEQIK